MRRSRRASRSRWPRLMLVTQTQQLQCAGRSAHSKDRVTADTWMTCGRPRRASRVPRRGYDLPASSPTEVFHRAQAEEAAKRLGSGQWHDDDVCPALPGGLREHPAFGSARGEVVNVVGVADRARRGREPLVGQQAKLLVPRPGVRAAASAADIGSLLRCHGRNREARSVLPREFERVRQRRVTRARRFVADEHAAWLFGGRLHDECSGELSSEDSDSTP